ncbi:MAG: DUF721 domain-containing protein [Nitrospirales bacterium]|nr:DUF721 domain-containing protein [Nitrospirales bacterium]
MMAGNPFNHIHSILNTVAQSYGLDTRFWEYRLQSNWDQIVGPAVAAHTQPDRITFRKLQLLVENSLWMQQLVFLKPHMLETINAAIGKPLITDILFRIGDVSHAQDKANTFEQLPALPTPSATMLSDLSHYTKHIKNPDLQLALTQVMAKALMVSPVTHDRTHRARAFPQTRPGGQSPA